MRWGLEVVVVPVSDLDAAKAFYADRAGFTVDHDSDFGGGNRLIQLTPPGSLKGLQLVVGDVRAARDELAGRGVDVSEVRVAGPEGFRPARAGDDLHNVGFAFFDDPDGNSWAVQQINGR